MKTANSDFSKNTNDLLYAEEWGLLSDELGQAVAQSFRYDSAESLEHEILTKRVNSHKIEVLKNSFPRPNALSTGNFTIGL